MGTAFSPHHNKNTVVLHSLLDTTSTADTIVLAAFAIDGTPASRFARSRISTAQGAATTCGRARLSRAWRQDIGTWTEELEDGQLITVGGIVGEIERRKREGILERKGAKTTFAPSDQEEAE